MSDGWSLLRDVDALADADAVLPFDIPIASMPRVLQAAAGPEGAASGHVTFGRQGGYAAAQLEYRAQLDLICQRCLGILHQQLAGSAHLLLVDDEAAAARVPEAETMLAPERLIRLLDIVEEELLLALPIVPRHEAARECEARELSLAKTMGATIYDGPADAEAVQRPFAALGEMMRRGERRGRGD